MQSQPSQSMHSASLYLLRPTNRLGSTHDLQEARMRTDAFLVFTLPLYGVTCVS